MRRGDITTRPWWDVVTSQSLALYPGYKKGPGTHYLRMRRHSTFCGASETMYSIAQTLSVNWFLCSEKDLPLTVICGNDDEKVIKALSSLLAKATCIFIHSRSTLWHVNLSAWSLPIASKQDNTDSCCQSDGSSDFKLTWICLVGSITPQCDLYWNTHVAVPDRNRILFRRIFQVHHQVWRAIALSFC